MLLIAKLCNQVLKYSVEINLIRTLESRLLDFGHRIAFGAEWWENNKPFSQFWNTFFRKLFLEGKKLVLLLNKASADAQTYACLFIAALLLF